MNLPKFVTQLGTKYQVWELPLRRGVKKMSLTEEQINELHTLRRTLERKPDQLSASDRARMSELEAIENGEVVQPQEPTSQVGQTMTTDTMPEAGGSQVS